MRPATIEYCVPSPQLLVNCPYPQLRRNLERLSVLGIGVEIYFDNRVVNEVGSGEARDLGRELDERGIFRTLHAPYMDLSPGGVDREVRAITIEKLKKAVGLAHYIGAHGMVCHGAYDRWRFGGNEQLWLDGSIATFSEVLKEAGDLPVTIENVFDHNPSALLALFGHFQDKLWLCFDTGHFNLFSALPLGDWLVPLKERLRELHLHDNHRNSDEHLPVGKGIFPFRELKQFLKSTGGLLFTAEARSEAVAAETIRYAKEFLG
jgi:sugar phosphate isomerase/epimerase